MSYAPSDEMKIIDFGWSWKLLAITTDNSYWASCFILFYFILFHFLSLCTHLYALPQKISTNIGTERRLHSLVMRQCLFIGRPIQQQNLALTENQAGHSTVTVAALTEYEGWSISNENHIQRSSILCTWHIQCVAYFLTTISVQSVFSYDPFLVGRQRVYCRLLTC